MECSKSKSSFLGLFLHSQFRRIFYALFVGKARCILTTATREKGSRVFLALIFESFVMKKSMYRSSRKAKEIGFHAQAGNWSLGLN